MSHEMVDRFWIEINQNRFGSVKIVLILGVLLIALVKLVCDPDPECREV